MKMIRGWLVVLCCGFMFACGDPADRLDGSGSETAAVENLRVTIETDGSENVRVTMPDGAVYTDLEQYENDALGYFTTALARGAEIEFVLANYQSEGGPFNGQPFQESDGYARVQRPLDGSLPGGYHWSLSVYRRNKQINGCIRKRCAPAFALRLHQNGRQLWDMHGGAFTNNGGRTCVGLYESESGWCKKACRPSLREIEGMLVDAAIQVGVPTATAYVIARVIAPAIVAALLL